MILADWDGGPSAGKGGTTDLVGRAAAMGMPIVMSTPKARRRRACCGRVWRPPVSGMDVGHLPSRPPSTRSPRSSTGWFGRRTTRDDAGGSGGISRRGTTLQLAGRGPVMLAVLGLRRAAAHRPRARRPGQRRSPPISTASSAAPTGRGEPGRPGCADRGCLWLRRREWPSATPRSSAAPIRPLHARRGRVLIGGIVLVGG